MSLLNLSKKGKVWLSSVLVILCIILLMLGLDNGTQTENNPGLTDFLGRFHPLIVHFPIVLILLALLGEGLNYFYKGMIQAKLMSGLILGAIASSLLSAYLGYYLFSSGVYEGELVQNHMWGGIWLTLAITSVGIADLFELKKFRLGFIILSNLLLIYTGHLGGSLTHGENYLSEYLTQINPADAPIMQKPRAEIKVFEDLIIPVFQAKCLSCHNKHKAKGGLRMETYAQLVAGGKSGHKLLDSLSFQEGELFRRIHLSKSSDEHMPPTGKAQLNKAEMNLLDWWLTSGGKVEQVVGTDNLGPELETAIDSYLPKLAAQQLSVQQRREESHQISQQLIPLATSLGFEIEVDTELDSFHFALSMKFPPETINDNSLIELLPYRHVISSISLIASGVTDEGLYTLGQMTSLRKLILAKTCIKGSGLLYLAKLPNLEVLNLSNTFVDDLGAMELTKLPQLKKVYLLDSEVNLAFLETLNAFLPEVKIFMEEGPLY